MPHELVYTELAIASLDWLEIHDKPRAKKVHKTLGLMEVNLRHPGLNSHKMGGMTAPDGRDLFEVYVENNTPGAFRILYCFGPAPNQLTILAITKHLPDRSKK